MGYELTEEQLIAKEMIKNFMEKELKPHAHEYDTSGEFPLEIYKKAFEQGLHMLDIPEEYGGGGFNTLSFGIALEEMGYHEPGFAITILSSALALKCVLLGGTDKQKEYVSTVLLNGGYGSYCLTEPSCGTDAVALQTRYEKNGDEYILNGSKMFVTNGNYSDIYIVFATKDRSLGAKGISAFIVEKGTPGLVIGKHEDKMGLRLSNTCSITFEDMRIPAENLLGEEGQGVAIAFDGLDAARLYNASVGVGIAQAALDESVRYAKVRESFGVPIIKHQAIQMILGDMAMRTEAARQLTRYGMYLADKGERVKKVAAEAKAFSSDNAMQVTTNAVQVFGGYGFSKEYPVEKMMRDAKIFAIFEGTNEIQRTIIARELERL